MANLIVSVLPRNGVSLDDVVAGDFQAFTAGPDKFVNSGKEIVVIKNDAVGAKTVTVTSQPDERGRTQDEVINIAAGEISIAGPFPPRAWSETSGADVNKVGLTPDSETDLFVMVLQISDQIS